MSNVFDQKLLPVPLLEFQRLRTESSLTERRNLTDDPGCSGCQSGSEGWQNCQTLSGSHRFANGKTTVITSERGYDGVKCDRKETIFVVDTLGLIWVLAVTPTDETEDSGACLVLSSIWEKIKKHKVMIQLVLRPMKFKGFATLSER